MAKLKSNSQKSLISYSKFWFWPLFAGGFFGLGYSITKNIYMSKIFPHKTNQEKLNHRLKNKASHVSLNKNDFQLKTKTLKTTFTPQKKFQNIIRIPTSDNSFRLLTISYSKELDSQKQKVFKKNLDFFQTENVENLSRTLHNKKKLNLLKYNLSN